MSTPNEIITLTCTFPNLTGGEGLLFHMEEINATNEDISPPRTLTATSNQSSIVNAFVNPDGLHPLDVDIRAVGPKPGNLSSCLVTISDGRNNPDNTPMLYVVQVNFSAAPDASAIKVAGREAVRKL